MATESTTPTRAVAETAASELTELIAARLTLDLARDLRLMADRNERTVSQEIRRAIRLLIESDRQEATAA